MNYDYLMFGGLAWIIIGILVGLLVMSAESYFIELSKHPAKYRMTQADLESAWPYYILAYPFLWFFLLLFTPDGHILLEFLKAFFRGEVLFPTDNYGE